MRLSNGSETLNTPLTNGLYTCDLSWDPLDLATKAMYFFAYLILGLLWHRSALYIVDHHLIQDTIVLEVVPKLDVGSHFSRSHENCCSSLATAHNGSQVIFRFGF